MLKQLDEFNWFFQKSYFYHGQIELWCWYLLKDQLVCQVWPIRIWHNPLLYHFPWVKTSSIHCERHLFYNSRSHFWNIIHPEGQNLFQYPEPHLNPSQNLPSYYLLLLLVLLLCSYSSHHVISSSILSSSLKSFYWSDNW